MAKEKVEKFDIVCGEGPHKTYTGCLAELIMLNKYGNQPDYFWNDRKYYDEYVRLIKLTGKIAKQVGKPKLAWYIYKEPAALFDKDVGLIIWSLKGYKFNNPEFTLKQLVEVYKNKFRPKEVQKVENPEVKIVEVKNKIQEFLGDI